MILVWSWGFAFSRVLGGIAGTLGLDMEVQEQAGGWNPIVVLALHCHKSFGMAKPANDSTPEQQLNHHHHNSFVSALAAVKRGVPPGVLTFLGQRSSCSERESSHFSCSCSSSVKSSNPAKAFFGLTLPNFGGVDCNDRMQSPSCSCCCQALRQDSWHLDSKAVAKPFLGLGLQGFSISGSNRCCCAKGKVENRVDSRDPSFEGIVNVSIMVLSMMFGHDSKQAGKMKPVNNSSGRKEAVLPVNEQLHPLTQIPVLGFLSQHFTRPSFPRPKRDRKRSRFMCTCGHREEEVHRKAAKRPFLGFSLADFMQFRAPTVENLVQNGGTKRLRSSRIATSGFARLQGEPDDSAGAAVVVPAEGREDVAEATTLIEKPQNPGLPIEKVKNSGLQIEKVKNSGLQQIQHIQGKLPNMDVLRSSLATLGVKEGVQEIVDRVSSMTRSSPDYPDKKKLTSVQDFFRYTEAEGEVFGKRLYFCVQIVLERLILIESNFMISCLSIQIM